VANAYQGICLRDFTLEAKNGDRLELKRGKEYTISDIWDDGTVTVFTNYWARVPSDLFGGVLSLDEIAASRSPPRQDVKS
jgi:hypothetical protein